MASSIVAFLRDQVNHAQMRGTRRGTEDAENLTVALECIAAVFAVATPHEGASQELVAGSFPFRASSLDSVGEDLKNQGLFSFTYFSSTLVVARQ